MFNWLRRDTVVLSGEEARTAMKALRRSAETFSPDETIAVRDMRAHRETRLADAIGARLN